MFRCLVAQVTLCVFFQWRANATQYLGQASFNLDKENWGWSWKERWIAARPWEIRAQCQVTKPARKPEKLSPPNVATKKISAKPGLPNTKEAAKSRKPGWILIMIFFLLKNNLFTFKHCSVWFLNGLFYKNWSLFLYTLFISLLKVTEPSDKWTVLGFSYWAIVYWSYRVWNGDIDIYYTDILEIYHSGLRLFRLSLFSPSLNIQIASWSCI